MWARGSPTKRNETHTHTTATWTQTAARATTVAEQAAAAAATDGDSAGRSRQRRRRRASVGVVNDVARLQTAGATSRRCVDRDATPITTRRRRRSTRRRWSAPNHGVTTPVDRPQLTTKCRFSGGYALRSSSSLSRITQRRPFSTPTDE